MPFHKKLLLPIVMLVIIVTVACSSAAPSSPAASSSPAAPSQAAASTAPSAKPTEVPAWKVEWDKVVAAAKKEGKVVVGGARGEGYTKAAAEFNKAYPEIKVEYTAMAGSEAAPRVLAERNQNLFLWDVYLGGSTTMLDPLMPSGVFQPLQPKLILPEVKDSSKWHSGFDDGFQDAANQYIYAFLGYLSYAALVNRDVPAGAALKTLDDLLDPKMKGMIVWQDPRVNGSGHKSGANMYIHKGEAWYRKLLSNDVMALTDARMVLERVARGTQAVALGSREDDENLFRGQGLLANAGYVDDGTAASAHITAGSGDIAAVDRAPHPNAQIVFINWLLSKQGQEAYVANTGIHSRRLDVPAGRDEASKPRSDIKYLNVGKEQYMVKLDEATAIAKDVIR